jgi:hypothetical protein
MSLIFFQREADTHLWVRVRGSPTLQDLLSLVDEVAAVTRERGIGRVLFDLTFVEESPDEEGQAALGAHAARQLAHLERIASVVPPDKRTGRSERAARDAGADLSVFTDEREAVAWLTGPAVAT